jgi:hypothetical protein
VTAVRDARGVPVHLTALVRHAADCLSLVSIGASEQPRLPSTLYLGNRGAVETNLVSGGVLIGGDDDPHATGSFHRQLDDRLDALTSWLRAAGSLARGEGRPSAQQAARHMARVALRTAIERGEIGHLRALHLDFHFIKGDAFGLPHRRVPAGTGPRDTWTFRDPDCATDATESGHNVIAKRELSEEGWYALALAWRLCPQPVRRVYATGGAYFLHHHHELDVEDFSTLVLTLEDGPVVSISTGRTGTHTHPGGGRMLVRAVGDRGTILVDGGQPPVLSYLPATPGQRNRPTGDSTGLAELVDSFVTYLDGDAPPPMTAESACAVMRVLDAAYTSFSTGDAVDVSH